MALIECKKCGATISDKAKACPKCGSLKEINTTTLSRNSNNQFYKMSSWAFLLISIGYTIVKVYNYNYDWHRVELSAISAILYSLAFYLYSLAFYLLIFTLALKGLKNGTNTATSILIISAISFVLCFIPEKDLQLWCSWIQRIMLLISFAIFAIKCKGWTIKVASIIQIVLRVMNIINLSFINSGKQLSDVYLRYDFFCGEILQVISAIFFVLSIKDICQQNE